MGRQMAGTWECTCPPGGAAQDLAALCRPRGPEEDLESNISTGSGGTVFGSDLEEADPGSATPARACETLVIFDWDDTLLPTSWLQAATQGRSLTEEQRGQLQALADAVEKTLRVAGEHGTVVVVTNAEEGWVQHSCRSYLPGLAPLLDGIEVVSARSAYEPLGHDPEVWKCLAFERVINGIYGPRCRRGRLNVLSLGDSMHERAALSYAASGVPGCRAKSLKLSGRPDVEHLADEHDLLSRCLEQAIRHDGDLDMEIDEEEPPAPPPLPRA